MGILSQLPSYRTIKIREQDEICFIQIYRPEANNTINDILIEEMNAVLDFCEASIKIVVLEGLPEVFCFGADFNEIQQKMCGEDTLENKKNTPESMYDLWLKLANGPYITIAHVRGKVNAGGLGFVAACDLAICDEKAVFSLSELLFGLMPACVLPFLIKRIGVSKANYLTLMTQPVGAEQALEWGLIDACEENSGNLLRKQLLRLRLLSKTGISRYKTYLGELDDMLTRAKPKALHANHQVFTDSDNLEKIDRYINTGKFPWET